MGYFDSVQEHGILSVVIALILIIINIFSNYVMLNRNIKIETITKDRNANIEKVRTLIAENLLAAHKLKRTVSMLFTYRKMDIKNEMVYSEKYSEAIDNYYVALNEFTYTYDLLMLYIQSIDPLVDTSEIEAVYSQLYKVMRIEIKINITNITERNLIDNKKEAYNKLYDEKIGDVKKHSAAFIKQWLEESYIDVLGKNKYLKMKK